MIIGYIIAFIIYFVFSFFFVNAIIGFIETYIKFKGTGLRFTRNSDYAGYLIMLVLSIMFGAALFCV